MLGILELVLYYITFKKLCFLEGTCVWNALIAYLGVG